MGKESVITATPFAIWRQRGEPDPHGNRFNGKLEDISLGSAPHDYVAYCLLHKRASLNHIAWLTAGKERLRWLSRKLLSMTAVSDIYCVERAGLPLGDLCDDVLANRFFITEAYEDLYAGHERIRWLSAAINRLESGWK